MSAGCCDDKADELAVLRRSQSRTLLAVLVINAAMFVIEFVAGCWTGSTALLADSLDMLGDSAVYAFSLFVLDRSERWRASAAVFKGALMAVFGVGVIVEGVRRAFSGAPPEAVGMGVIGLLALLANGVCMWLLLRHRSDDLNMRSTWLCSRNDVISNLGVIGAAATVGWTGSHWPDILVGAVIAVLFLESARSVLKEAVAAWKTSRASPNAP